MPGRELGPESSGQVQFYSRDSFSRINFARQTRVPFSSSTARPLDFAPPFSPNRIMETDSPDASSPPAPLDDALVETTILRLLDARGPGRTISPMDVATALIPGAAWNRAMTPVRRAAIRLADGGRVVIYRKGKPADAHDFKGVYRLGLAHQD